MTQLVQQMGHVTLQVPDPMASARDLVDLVGVKITHQSADEVMLSSNTRRYEVIYRKGSRTQVLALGLEAVSHAAIDEVARRVKAEGLPVIAETSLHPDIAKAIRFRDPCGAIYEVHSPIPRTEGVMHVGVGSRPTRLEHVNILVPDPKASREFLVRVLGMKVSDYAGEDLLAWARAADGYHHTVAIGPGPGKLHHYAFDHRSVEDLVGIADTLVLKDRWMLWGPGRHGAGGNIFTYYIDHDGCIVENSVEMSRVDHEEIFAPNHWSIGEGMSGRWINQWGGGPPADFGDHGMPFAG
jgi:catechol 2,3-dioxygenase